MLFPCWPSARCPSLITLLLLQIAALTPGCIRDYNDFPGTAGSGEIIAKADSSEHFQDAGDARRIDSLADGPVAEVRGTDQAIFVDTERAGDACKPGDCPTPCELAALASTNAGCEFYAVDLDNAEEYDFDAQHAQFAIVVSNTDQGTGADVTVFKPDGLLNTAHVPPMSLHTFELPPTWSLDGTMKEKWAFRITSSLPIVAYQFNPLSNIAETASSDASVLLPIASMGKEHYVMTLKQYDTSYRGYFSIVGTSEEPTEVTFAPTTKTLAGSGLPSVAAGESYSVSIEQGEVLNVESDLPWGDLTGTRILATAPVAVFGGHEAGLTAEECCADHLEQQLLPVNTWRKYYLVTKTWERWKEKDHIRILASQDGTEVTLDPEVAQVPTLNAGQFYHFQSKDNIEITATEPILVAQYLASSFEILGGSCPAPFIFDDFSEECIGPECESSTQCPNATTCEEYGNLGGYCDPIGDPTMMLAISPDGFLSSYVFLTPDGYVADYLNIIAPLNASKVVLDDNQVNPAGFIPIGKSDFGVFRTEISDGVHQVWSDKKIGIMVYGYDNDVSYGYPGGIALGLVESD
jgi:hypothetical protein